MGRHTTKVLFNGSAQLQKYNLKRCDSLVAAAISHKSATLSWWWNHWTRSLACGWYAVALKWLVQKSLVSCWNRATSNCLPRLVTISAGVPKWATHVETREVATVSTVTFDTGAASGQRMKRLMIVVIYWDTFEGGKGPNKSMWLTPKRESGRANLASDIVQCLYTLHCRQVRHMCPVGHIDVHVGPDETFCHEVLWCANPGMLQTVNLAKARRHSSNRA